MRRLLLPTLLLLLGGCQAIDFGAAKPATLLVSQAVRAVQIEVRGPQSLAAGGQILSDAGAGLWSGGMILSDAGAGLTGGTSAYGVLDAAASFVPVAHAGLQLLRLDGTPVGSPVESDAQGNVTLPSVPDGQPLSAVAAFETGGKVYRLAVLLAPGAQPAPVFADPINTLVEAAVRSLLAQHPNAHVSAMTFQELKQVWTIADQAGVTVDPADLQADLPPEQLLANLSKLWQQAIDSTITSPADKQTVEDFMNAIKTAVAGS